MKQQLTTGQKDQRTLVITTNMVKQFAESTTDTNPLHLDEAFAKQTRFGKPIAHGMLGAGLISAVLGMQLPGPGTIYLSQSLNFKAPAFIGDTLCAQVEVVEIKGKICKLITTVTNQNKQLLIDGEATVLVEKNES